MTNLPPTPDSGDDPGVWPGREYPGIPRWVKVSGIIVIVLVLLVGILLLTGIGGDHGPSRHAPSGDAGGDTPFSIITEDPTPFGGDLAGHTPPSSVTEHGVQQL